MVPKESDRRLSTEKMTGEKWYWRRDRKGWPDWEKVESEKVRTWSQNILLDGKKERRNKTGVLI